MIAPWRRSSGGGASEPDPSGFPSHATAGTSKEGPSATGVEVRDMCIGAGKRPSEVVHWAQLSGGGLAKGQCGLVEGVDDGGEWKVARGLVLVRGGLVLLRIANVHPFPIDLPRRRPLVTIAGIDCSQVQGGRNMVLQTPNPGEVVIDVRTTQAPARAGSPLDLLEAEGLTPDQQQQFRELIRRWAGVFAAHEENFELRSLLRVMLESGVIAESASPGAAQVVLVRKKDGVWRFYVDYWRLNAVTHRDA
ncbi:hypothetical protein SKAU_G00058650 [Synaphobranchus kaupii]|uniref:Uncharacterized protein n=1 Tax=Synaphobranchus kaupii TaxID=118154 RepID=A0A9Q1JAH6_SYNKA|nr:hypothetical protein SKAU_G00058650 [Synaphobranchus kaupii]